MSGGRQKRKKPKNIALKCLQGNVHVNSIWAAQHTPKVLHNIPTSGCDKMRFLDSNWKSCWKVVHLVSDTSKLKSNTYTALLWLPTREGSQTNSGKIIERPKVHRDAPESVWSFGCKVLHHKTKQWFLVFYNAKATMVTNYQDRKIALWRALTTFHCCLIRKLCACDFFRCPHSWQRHFVFSQAQGTFTCFYYFFLTLNEKQKCEQKTTDERVNHKFCGKDEKTSILPWLQNISCSNWKQCSRY